MKKKMLKTFRYNGNHLQDETYMMEMCHQGWAAIRLVEGFWKFEPCQPDEYCYRICYLRGKSREEIEYIKKDYANRGIQFVSQYFFWAIFRSHSYFQIYNPKEKRIICREIMKPMPIGAIAGWLATLIGIVLTICISVWFIFMVIPAVIYAGIVTYCGLSYWKLIRSL